MSFCAAAPYSERARSRVGDTTYGHSKEVIRKQRRQKSPSYLLRLTAFKATSVSMGLIEGRNLSLKLEVPWFYDNVRL
jgi:hypothetical protein